MLSQDPVSSRVPSGENATASKESACPVANSTNFSVAASHGCLMLSPDPVRVATALPVAASHSRAVLSQEPVRTRVPSGENVTAVTGAECPSRNVRSPQLDDQLRQAPSSEFTADVSSRNTR